LRTCLSSWGSQNEQISSPPCSQQPGCYQRQRGPWVHLQETQMSIWLRHIAKSQHVFLTSNPVWTDHSLSTCINQHRKDTKPRCF
jgi:hypothetical protein